MRPRSSSPPAHSRPNLALQLAPWLSEAVAVQAGVVTPSKRSWVAPGAPPLEKAMDEMLTSPEDGRAESFLQSFQGSPERVERQEEQRPPTRGESTSPIDIGKTFTFADPSFWDVPGSEWEPVDAWLARSSADKARDRSVALAGECRVASPSAATSCPPASSMSPPSSRSSPRPDGASREPLVCLRNAVVEAFQAAVLLSPRSPALGAEAAPAERVPAVQI